MPAPARFAAASALEMLAGFGSRQGPMVPVAAYWGAGPNMLDERALDGLMGARSVKVKIGRAEARDERRMLECLLESLPGACLRLDGNRSMRIDACTALVAGLPRERIEYFEEPIEDPSMLGALRDATGIHVGLDELIVDGHASKTVDHYIFADGWYCRLDHKNRSFTKRSIARGEDDPLQSVGGQIPSPIGLKKTDILARFTVNETQIPVDIPILGSMQNVAGLKLVPKEGTEAAKETDSLELFFDRVSLAPIGVVIRAKVARPEMARWTAARLTAPVVNGDVSEADRAKLVVPERAPEGWATVDETK
jgi:hypothetical protein